MLAEPGPYDSLVTHVAARLAKQEEGEILLYRVVPSSCSQEDIHSHSAYHEQLGEMIQCQHASLVERSDSPIQAIAERSKNFDLIVMGAHPEKALKTLLFGSYEHRLAEAVQCSVLRLKTPRDMVHPRLAMGIQEHPERLELGPAIEKSAMGVQLKLRSKEEMFSQMAKLIAPEKKLSPKIIENAIWQRERFQSTALTGGMALMAATCSQMPGTQLGVITAASPVDFRGPGRRKVDCFFVVLAPPGERQRQLWLLAQIARMALRSDFLDAVRNAKNEEELRAVLVRFGGNGLL